MEISRLVFLFFLCVMVGGCSAPITPNYPAKDVYDLAGSFIVEHGYTIIRYVGESSFVWNEKERSSDVEWQLFTQESSDLLDREIHVERFEVTDHALDQLSEYDKTCMEVWSVNGEIVGGTSYPVSTIPNEGHSFTLFGERTGYTVQEDKWLNRLRKSF